ncbi:MAG: hypothetical protein K6F35_01880 [Lachnospiraceae bacterium]|nr:hypothetical protein [Lachnospiraceae bacterium]
MSESIFREKSIERVSSPEQLNDYIHVSGPSVWLVMAAMIIVLLGVLIWSIFGTVEMNTAEGKAETVHPISFVIN